MNRKIYSEEKYIPWDGDMSRIPEPNALIAIELASCGLRNHVVTGYEITYATGPALIRIKTKCAKDGHSNERFITDIYPPLTIREKALIGDSIYKEKYP